MAVTSQAADETLDRLTAVLADIRNHLRGTENSLADDVRLVHPSYRPSARNLLHYLALRQHDLRDLQQDLASHGLSSLGRSESCTLVSVDAVLTALQRMADQPFQPPEPTSPPPVDFNSGPALLQEHTRELLGDDPRNRSTRIMVTMPTEAASDPQLIYNLVYTGMDVMRINCAHDSADDWAAMIENLRHAEHQLGRRCRVLMDLGGRKLRTGLLDSTCRVVKIKPVRNSLGRVTAPAAVWLTTDPAANPSPHPVDVSLPTQGDWWRHCRPGDVLELIDVREKNRSVHIVKTEATGCLAEVFQTLYADNTQRMTVKRNRQVVAQVSLGQLPPVSQSIVLSAGDTLVLTHPDIPGQQAELDASGSVVTPPSIPCTLPEVFEHIQPGHRILFDDGKISGIITSRSRRSAQIQITHTNPRGSKLRGDRGINLPDTSLPLSALSQQDIAALPMIAQSADLVGLSFVRTPEDVQLLQDHMSKLGGRPLGVVLKIETRSAFECLPRILLTAMRSPPIGVMVARGDLAVEIGFERLAEVQEEILWLCEAAHVPVIWATQVLETLAQKGAPSRAEITDAATGVGAEGVMLNKGPYVVEAVRFLGDILERMQAHQQKKRSMLRRLSVSQIK